MELYDYQVAGVRHLVTPVGGKHYKALLDSPGTGKTAMACAALNEVQAKSAVIITKAAPHVKRAWRRHLIDWGVCTADQIQIVETGKDGIGGCPFVITNYEMARQTDIYNQLYWGKYDAIIFDEAHALKNWDGKTAQKFLSGGSSSFVSRSKYVWCLSGTLMPNRPAELYTFLAALQPQLIAPHTDWVKYIMRYCAGFQNSDGWHYNGASNVEELAERIAPFILQRKLEDVYKELPEVIETDVFMDIGDFGADETNTPQATLRRLVGEHKLPFVLDFIVDWLEENPSEKVIVFTYHREFIDKLTTALNERFKGIADSIYGGDTPSIRQRAIDSFLSQKSRQILLAQRNTVGEAVDGFQNVCHNIIDAEPDWSPGGYEQQIGRLRRLGQKKPVNVIACIAENTLDEVVINVRRRKDYIIQRLMDGVRKNQIPPRGNDSVMHNQGENEMSLEDQIKRVADALETLVALQGPKLAIGNGSVPNQTETATATDATVNGKGAKGGKGKPASTPEVKAEEPENAPMPQFPSVEETRKAACDAVIRLGDTDENRQRVRGITSSLGSPSGQVDALPQEARAAAIAQFNAMQPIAAQMAL